MLAKSASPSHMSGQTMQAQFIGGTADRARLPPLIRF